MPYLIHYAVAAGSLPNAKYRADIFGAQFAVPNSYDSYEKLALDVNVDIVYVGATNQLHYPIVMMMLHAGKHVLVEKVCGAAQCSICFDAILCSAANSYERAGCERDV